MSKILLSGLRHSKVNHVAQAGAHLMARMSFEQMWTFWPRSTDAYAAPMNNLPKV